METKPIRSIVLIGAGKLATQLGLALKQKGMIILQVVSHSHGPGKKLAEKLMTSFVSDLFSVSRDADLYILAVSDEAISKVVKDLKLPGKLLVHTSGSVNMNELKPASSRIGVLYPLQTFSPHRRTGFRDIPVCVEAAGKADERKLVDFGGLLSENVRIINSDQRKVLHLSAVFANNFTNFMYTIAEDLLHKHDIPFKLIEPLIKRTALNSKGGHTFSHQTGPAIREDFPVMKMHMELLANQEAYKEIYDLLSKNIIQYKKTYGKL